jgi:hypothetical protein
VTLKGGNNDLGVVIKNATGIDPIAVDGQVALQSHDAVAGIA